ncbi:MAG: T9SS type A sorting domain-containing protein [Bacteroidetes bacterium]|nr:T9SS type A sorting domain-containing protein [Bacteroidota bacterium]
MDVQLISRIVTDPTPVTSSISGNMTICNGFSTTLTVTATGGTGPYTYNWTPGGSLSSTTTSVVIASPSSTQTYTVTATDALGCVATYTVMVTVNPSPIVSTTNSTICVGSNATLNATGANTFTWNPGNLVGAVQNVNPVSNTTYTVVGTNTLSGCTNSTTALVTVNTLPTANAGPTRTLTCANTSTTLAGSSVGGVVYNWTGPGIVSGGTTLTPTVNLPGVYSLVATSAQGCTSISSNVTVTQNTTAPTPSASNSTTLTCLTTTGTILGTGGGTYNWSGPGITAGAATATPTINLPGTYNLTVTAANGCTATANTSVTQNTVIPLTTASNSSTLTCTTTTVSLLGGPAAGVSYQWSGAGLSGGTTSQNAVANAAGIYTLLATSLTNGCTKTATTSLTQNVTPPAPTAANSSTLTCSTTTAMLSGTGGGTYNWSGPSILSGGTSASPIINAPGCYTLIVTSAINGCTATVNTCVTQNTIAPTTNTNVSGTLNCTLTTVNASATTTTTPVTYNWTGAGITSATNISTITVNAPGTKIIQLLIQQMVCITSGSLNVTQNLAAAAPTATVTGTVTCLTNTVQLSGNPAAGVTYTWAAPGGSSIASGVNTQNAIGNGHGTYTLIVTMISSGCSSSKTVTATQNTVTPTSNAGLDQSLTCASPTVTLNGTSVPSSCTPVWTGGVASGSNSFNASASSAGDYTLTVTNPANGCSATDIVQVTANASIPTITISVSNTLTCANTTATTSASSSAALPTYLWSGPSIVSGGTTANAIVDQPGNYTVTITDIPTGCSATSNINVTQDITLPSVTVTSSPSVICSGNSSTLTANGALTYTWSTTQNTTSISVSPGTTSSYTVSGTGTNGCVNSAIETITVNATPTLAITGNTNICNGSTSTLTGSGATSYTWDSGANTTTISVTPTITTTYTLTGDNGNGCSSLLPVTVSIIPNKAISGVVTSTNGATGGDIIIYKYTGALSQWDQLTLTPISGTYSFNNVDSGLYVIRAIPTATNIQVTYAPNSISWQGATIINHGCTNNTTQNIDLIGFVLFVVGPGVVTGNIVEAAGFGARMSNDESKPAVPGTPIGGIIVKGGKNPGGQMYVQTLTDASGNYTLTGFPINTLPDDYFVFVDIPGLDTNSTYYHISFAVNDTVVNGLDFNVDAQYINPIGSVTAISNDQSVLESKITLFPNPANQKFTLEYELIQSANVEIELFDVVGHKVKTISSNSFEEKDKHSHSVNIEDLSTGVYFVKVKINNSETTIKLIIN